MSPTLHHAILCLRSSTSAAVKPALAQHLDEPVEGTAAVVPSEDFRTQPKALGFKNPLVREVAGGHLVQVRVQIIDPTPL